MRYRIPLNRNPQTHTHMHTHAHAYAHMHAYAHTHPHTHTHIHTDLSLNGQWREEGAGREFLENDGYHCHTHKLPPMQHLWYQNQYYKLRSCQLLTWTKHHIEASLSNIIHSSINMHKNIMATYCSVPLPKYTRQLITKNNWKSSCVQNHNLNFTRGFIIGEEDNGRSTITITYKERVDK